MRTWSRSSHDLSVLDRSPAVSFCRITAERFGNVRPAFTLAGRYASRSFGTIDNSNPVTHTYQGFESYLVFDARANFRIIPHWEAAVGVENIGNEKYFIFHPFPQRSLSAELTFRW